MKQYLLPLLTILFFALTANPVHAAAAAPTTKLSPTTAPNVGGEKLDQQINQLKNKIASRVAELNLVEKRGFIGVVTQVEGTKLTLTDVAGKTRFVDVDEITKYTGGKANFDLSDITKGTRISVLGLYNKQSKRILARFINLATSPTFLSGVISDIDSKKFIVTIMTEDQKQIKLDVQTATKVLTQDKEEGMIKYGFSKLKINDRVYAIGAPDKKNPALFSTTRLIVLPELPQNPKIMIAPTDTPITDTIKQSTGSGKKLTPVR